jgi:hypothetical protein
LETRLAPVEPPAPPTFSMMICWLISSLMGGARMRATTSIGPPAGKGTTMVTVRLGQSSALAGLAQASQTANAAIVLTMVASRLRTLGASPLNSIACHSGAPLLRRARNP